MKHVILGLVLLFGGFTVSAADLLDINKADEVTIAETLKGIGQVKAKAIVKYREENGPYKSIEELVNVSGIGETTLEKIRSQIVVETEESEMH